MNSTYGRWSANIITERLAQPQFVALSFSAAWLILFGPVYVHFFSTAWARPENAHAPFLLAICVGLAYAEISSSRVQLRWATTPHGVGLILLSISLLAYAYARIQEIELLLSATQVTIAAAAILLFFGMAGMRRLWFVLVLSLYLITWPGWMIDMLTFPLKIMVSEVVSTSLNGIGFPVTHEGAVIAVGPYSLLVADACAGLNSMIALTSIGVVYLYLVRRGNHLSNGITILMLVPISIFANLLRVASLVLITHWFGYNAGQNYLHDLSGIVMFVAALASVFLVEALAFMIVGKRRLA